MDWQFADKNAPLIGVPSCYVSSRWDLGEDLRFDSVLGEQAGAQPWRNGSKPGGLTGARLCFPLDTFTTGIVPDTSPRPVDEGGLPLCCGPAAPGAGGAIVGGRSDCEPGCDCAVIVSDLEPDVGFWSAQCPFLGATMDLDKTGPCLWSGVWHAWSGDFTQRMYFAAGSWTWEIDTSPMSVFTVPGDVCLPLTIDYFVPNLSLQPFALGIPCPGDITLRFLRPTP